MKFGTKRFTSVLLTIAMLLSILPATVSFAAKSNKLQTTDGYLMLEAEDLKFDKTAFGKVSNKKMWSGGSALSVLKNMQNPVPEVTEDAHIDLSFTADKVGTYSVWVRNTAQALNSVGNSVYMSIGMGNYQYTGLIGTPEIPAWTKIASVTASKDGDDLSVRLRARQMEGICLDTFVFTNDPSFSPKDENLGMENLIGIRQKPTPPPLEIDESGCLVIEAEELREFNEDNYYIASDNKASGGKALYPKYQDKTVPYSDATADLDLSFTAAKSGYYNIWVRFRGISTNNNADSIFYSDKYPDKAYEYKGLRFEDNEYSWNKLAGLSSGPDEIAYCRIIRRQLVYVDKIIITNSPTFIPVGADDTPENETDVVLPSGGYSAPPVTPKKGQHPTLWFQKDDIPAIKANLEHPQNIANWEKAKIDMNAEVQVVEGYNGGKHWDQIEARAFDYVINGNKEHGKEAIDLYLQCIAIANYTGDNFDIRQYGGAISLGARIYDWCYDLMNDEERKVLLKNIEAKCYLLTCGYPPTAPYITGHASEGMFLAALLELAIATYDDRPDIYTNVAGRFFDCYVPARDYWYKSYSSHQGTAYMIRSQWDLFSALLFKMSLDYDPYDMEGFSRLPYEFIYNSRPDGQHIGLGDEFFKAQGAMGEYWSNYRDFMMMGAKYFQDGYLKREQSRENVYYDATSSGNERNITPVMFLLMNDPYVEENYRDDLPLAMYFPSPNGMMFARTGWNDGIDAPDAVAMMKIGELFGGNHDHLDMGSFQLYYKGGLATDSGVYGSYGTDHHNYYQQASIAHNIVTVLDPNEATTTTLLDGGYQFPNGHGEPVNFDTWVKSGKYDVAKVTAHEIGPDTYVPDYTYIAGDLTKAYSQNNSDKVSEALRSMVFLPLDDEDHPAALVVFDKITSKKADFRKSWLLHMQEEPKVDGNKTIVTRTTDGYNGRMVNETLLPKETEITAIGGAGKQCWVAGKNLTPPNTGAAAEVGWGRVEVSPKQASNTDYFLNVMTVSDADTTAPDVENILIENDAFAGAAFANKAVVFNRDKKRADGTVSFTMPNGQYDLLVCGLKAGTWDVNGTKAVANEDGGCIYVPVNGGSITLTYSGTDADKAFTSNKVSAPAEKIGVRVNNGYIYSDVDPIIVNDRTLVPMRAIFEAFEADVSYDDKTATASAVLGDITIKITEGSNIAYKNDKAVELDVTATIYNDRFVVPVRFISESFGADVKWDDLTQTVMIKYSKPVVLDHNPTEPGEIKIISARDSWTDRTEPSSAIACALDNNTSTRWALESVGGKNYENTWGIFDFGIVYELDKLGMAMYQSNGRVAYFGLEVSEDGENWTKVIDDDTPIGGNTPTDVLTYFDLNGAKARYAKIRCGGSSTTTWFSPTEIKFIKK